MLSLAEKSLRVHGKFKAGLMTEQSPLHLRQNLRHDILPTTEGNGR